MVGDINLGMRHVPPIYAFLAMLGAIGAASLLRPPWFSSASTSVVPQSFVPAATQTIALRPASVFACGLIRWEVVACILAAPQFKTYFNETGMLFFGYVLAYSVLDLGQDFYHLEDRHKSADP